MKVAPVVFAPLVPISVRAWVDPRAILWLQEISERKTPMTPSAIKPATFRLAAPRLNQLRTPFLLRTRQNSTPVQNNACNWISVYQPNLTSNKRAWSEVKEATKAGLRVFNVAVIPDTQFGELNIALTNRVRLLLFCLCYVVSFCVETNMPKINRKSRDMFRSRYVNAYQTGQQTRSLYCKVPV